MSAPTKSTPKNPGIKSGFSLRRWILRIVALGVGLAVCAGIVVGLAVALAWPTLPDLSAMIDYRPVVPLRVYTADKVLIGEFGEEHRNVIPFDKIPDVLKHAVLSAEDDHFYQHGGVDWGGVVRAALTNLMSGAKTQGASTITMQVARNFYLSSEKTYSRKLYELLLTFKIEHELSKDQILELYMNQIYLGHRAYGFAAAARTYLGKELADITPAEAALLAGIPKAPSRYNPLANLPRAQVRQHYVLGRMRALNYLNDAQYKTAMDQPLNIGGKADRDAARALAVHGEYPAELARQLMYNVFQDTTYTRGIDVITTIQSKDQQAAYRAIRSGVMDYTRRAAYPGPEDRVEVPAGIENNPGALDDLLDDLQEKTPDSDDLLTAVVLDASPTKVTVARSSHEIITITDKKALGVVARALSPKAREDVRLDRGAVVYIHKVDDHWEIVNMPTLQAALVSLTPDDGAIRSMIGGFDFARGAFNRATQAFRQPGSNIKPFIYAAALERGFTPATQISDQPFTMTAQQTGSQAWAPKNDGNKYEPFVTLRQALYKSKNMVSIRILQAITPQYGQDFLTRFGFDKARWPAVLPLALGAGGATPLQVASAYSVFANGGFRVTPYLVARVTDRTGKVLMEAQPEVANQSAPRVIDPRTAWVMNDILRGVATYGTGSRAHKVLKRNDVAGKTGTTNDSYDVWFSGFTPALVETVWMGFDQPHSLGSNEFGAGLALSAWLDSMGPALKDIPQAAPRPKPDGLIVDNGEYYFSEFPPGQSVASLDLIHNNNLDDFLNSGMLGGGTSPSGSASNTAANGASAAGHDNDPVTIASPVSQVPSQSYIPPIPVPQ